VAISLHAYRTVPVEPLRGRSVIDTSSYYPEQRDARIAELAAGTATTGELLQAHLPESHVVKAFRNIFFLHLANLVRSSGAADRSALPIAGDDTAAKEQVTAFLDSIGYDTVDAGPLAEGWRFERDKPAHSKIYFSEGHSYEDLLKGGDPGPGGQVAADTLRQRLAEARR